MRWFEVNFNKDLARQFLEECWNFTSEYVLNNARELVPSWPLTNIMPKSVFKFEPDGAVIHISETPSMWNALRMQTGHVFASHFIVMAGQRAHALDRYPLLKQLPSTVFMLYPVDAMIPHAGFLSPRTWGIELRNAGRLRPVKEDIEVMPLMPSEETERNFTAIDNGRYDCYWRQDLWRHKFEGPVGRFENSFYEMPTLAQVTSLIALLRALDCLYGDEENYGLDRRLVVPSNCVSAQSVKLPFIHWDGVRNAMLDREIINPEWEWLAPLSTDPCQFEGHDLDWDDESLLAEQFDHVRWRGDRDDGQANVLDEERAFALANGYKRSLAMLGYDTSDCDFSLAMWAIARGLGTNTDEIVYARMNQESRAFTV
jgi:hypothetical protein